MVPPDFDRVSDVKIEDDRILVFGDDHKSPVIVPARGVGRTHVVSSR
jgi:hypothetical protein